MGPTLGSDPESCLCHRNRILKAGGPVILGYFQSVVGYFGLWWRVLLGPLGFAGIRNYTLHVVYGTFLKFGLLPPPAPHALHSYLGRSNSLCEASFAVFVFCGGGNSYPLGRLVPMKVLNVSGCKNAFDAPMRPCAAPSLLRLKTRLQQAN